MLVLAFIGVAWVQSRQVSLLYRATQRQDDYLVWSLFQLETEYLRLRGELQRALDRPALPLDREALQLRY